MNCLIWNTPAAAEPRIGDYYVIYSTRAGGQYKIMDSVAASVSGLSTQQKQVLTTWLCDQRRLGVPVPQITTHNLNNLILRHPMPVSRKMERALLFLADHSPRIDQSFDLGNHSDPLTGAIIAETECQDATEVSSLLQMMGGMGLVWAHEHTPLRWKLTADGWKRIEGLRTHAVESAKAFVAMWLHDTMQEPYENGLYKAIYDCGYDPLRVDQEHHHLNKVDWPAPGSEDTELGPILDQAHGFKLELPRELPSLHDPTSRLRRTISSCSGFIWPWPGKACCGSSENFFTQSRSCEV